MTQNNIPLTTVFNEGQICLLKLVPLIICSGPSATVQDLYFEKFGLKQVFGSYFLFTCFAFISLTNFCVTGGKKYKSK